MFTLSAVVIDVGVLGVVLDRFLKTLKGLRTLALLHVHARDLHPALCQGGIDFDGFIQVILSARYVTHKEPIQNLVGAFQSKEQLT